MVINNHFGPFLGHFYEFTPKIRKIDQKRGWYVGNTAIPIQLCIARCLRTQFWNDTILFTLSSCEDYLLSGYYHGSSLDHTSHSHVPI